MINEPYPDLPSEEMTALVDDGSDGLDVPVATISTSAADQASTAPAASPPHGEPMPAAVIPTVPYHYAQPILIRLRKDVAPLVKTFLAKRNEYHALHRELDGKGLTRGAAERRHKEIAAQFGRNDSIDSAARTVDEMNRLRNIPTEAIRHARTLLLRKFGELKEPLDALFAAVCSRLNAYEAEAVSEETKLFKKFSMKREETGVTRRIHHVRRAAEAQHARYAALLDQAQMFRWHVPLYELSGFNQLFGTS